jgi:hypothetical protein
MKSFSTYKMKVYTIKKKLFEIINKNLVLIMQITLLLPLNEKDPSDSTYPTTGLGCRIHFCILTGPF